MEYLIVFLKNLNRLKATLLNISLDKSIETRALILLNVVVNTFSICDYKQARLIKPASLLIFALTTV